MTKKERQFLWNVMHSNNESLYDVYKSFSQDKYLAYERCKGEMYRKEGVNFRITSVNTFIFCCGFLYRDCKNILHCRYYTGKMIYDFIAE